MAPFTGSTENASDRRTVGLMSAKNSKPAEIRNSNIRAGKALADAIRTSLGPRGMDKMIKDQKGEVTITNDGATILDRMEVVHPAAKMLVQLSKAQDVEAGDGTTTVVILAGSLLEAAEKLLKKGIHPTTISESFLRAAQKCVELLMTSDDLAIPVDLGNREKLMESAVTSLNSKVVSQHSAQLAAIAVDAVLRVTVRRRRADGSEELQCNMKDIKIVKKPGGTMDETELFDGLVLTQPTLGAIRSVDQQAKVGLIQFHLSPPKTDMDNQVVVSDYTAMDRVLREERAYILNIVKQIKKAGCNVLLIQKSILRDAITDLGVHFLDKMKIMVVKDIERDEVEHICKSIGCRPIASLDHFTAENLVTLHSVEERSIGGSASRCIFFTTDATHAAAADASAPTTTATIASGPVAAAAAANPATNGTNSDHAAAAAVANSANEAHDKAADAATPSSGDAAAADAAAAAASEASATTEAKTKLATTMPTSTSPRTVSIIIRGSNRMMLEEADRSIHDALCVIRCLVRTRLLVAGGGAPETELYLKLMEFARSLVGADAYCIAAFASALEVIPYTLAENAGLNPIATVTQLRQRHATRTDPASGINVRRGCVTNMLDERVVQPMQVTTSAITLAAETVRSILKIDDIINAVH